MCALSRNQERFFFSALTKETKEIIHLIQRKQKLFLFLSSYKVNFICKRSLDLIALSISLLYKRNVQGVPRPLVWKCHFQVCEHSLHDLFLSFSGRLPTSMPAFKLYCAKISNLQRSGLFFIGNVSVIKASKQLLGGNNFQKAVACVRSLFCFSREMLSQVDKEERKFW